MKVGIVGFGTMGEMLLRGILDHLSEDVDVYVYDVMKEKIEFANQNYRIYSCKDELECAVRCQTLFLCVKPKDMTHCLAQMAPALRAPKSIISIVAGVGFKRIQQILAEHAPPSSPGGSSGQPFQRIARLMPNTPCKIKEGAMGFWFSDAFTEEEKNKLRGLVSSIGTVVDVAREEDIDCVTALAGSGPAYLYLFAQSLIDAGIKNGLSESVARTLVVRTLRGAAGLMEQTAQPLEELIQQVRTPGGTTEAALSTLEASGFQRSVELAISNAVNRARELGKL